jgi:hypothetical protein
MVGTSLYPELPGALPRASAAAAGSGTGRAAEPDAAPDAWAEDLSPIGAAQWS